MRLSPLFQRRPQRLQMLGRNLGRTTQRPPLPSLLAGVSSSFPAHGRGAADAASAGDFRLALSFTQQPHPHTAAAFHLFKVSASAFGIHHAHTPPLVTHLCKTQ